MATLLTQQCDRCSTKVEWDPSKTKAYRYVIDDSAAGDLSRETSFASSRSALAVSGGVLGQGHVSLDGGKGGTRTIMLPEDWGVLEINVGHDKQVQEICPACAASIRSFVNDHDRQLPAATEE